MKAGKPLRWIPTAGLFHPNISQLFPAASSAPRHTQNARLLRAAAAGSDKRGLVQGWGGSLGSAW